MTDGAAIPENRRRRIFLPGCRWREVLRFCFSKLQTWKSTPENHGGPCRSESYIVPLLKQRFAQLATGTIYDSSLSGPRIREERCTRLFHSLMALRSADFDAGQQPIYLFLGISPCDCSLSNSLIISSTTRKGRWILSATFSGVNPQLKRPLARPSS